MERKYIKCKTCDDWHWSDKRYDKANTKIFKLLP